MNTASSPADLAARRASRRRSRGVGAARLLAGVMLAGLAVGLSYWMGKESLAGSAARTVAAIGLAGLVSAVLAVVVVGRQGR